MQQAPVPQRAWHRTWPNIALDDFQPLVRAFAFTLTDTTCAKNLRSGHRQIWQLMIDSLIPGFRVIDVCLILHGDISNYLSAPAKGVRAKRAFIGTLGPVNAAPNTQTMG